MGKLTVEEKALETFPDEIFNKDFQEEALDFYKNIINKIAFIDGPLLRFSDNAKKLNIIYKCRFFGERDEFKMHFFEPKEYFYGVIDIDPNSENSPFCDEFKKRNGIYIPPELIVSNPKFFKRKIVFIDLRHKMAILEHLKCDPVVLSEADKRFPSRGIIIIENNEIIRNANIAKPSSEQFPKLRKFIGKVDKMLKNLSDIGGEDCGEYLYK